MKEKGNRIESLGIDVPLQPQSKKDPLYKLIRRYIKRGDYTAMAEAIGVHKMTVSHVARGERRSERIWNYIIQTVVERKEQENRFASYLETQNNL